MDKITNIYDLLENKKKIAMKKNCKYGLIFIVLTAWLTFGLNIREKNDIRLFMLITTVCIICFVYKILTINIINEMDIKEISSKDMEFIMEIRKESDKYNINKKRYWYIFLLLFFTIVINSKILFIPAMIFPILLILYLNNKIEKKLSVMINSYDYNNGIEENVKKLKIKNREEFFRKYNIVEEKLEKAKLRGINRWKMKQCLNWIEYKKMVYTLDGTRLNGYLIMYLIFMPFIIILLFGNGVAQISETMDKVNIGIEDIVIVVVFTMIKTLIIVFLFKIMSVILKPFEIRIDNSNIYFIKTLFREEISFYKKKDINECFIKERKIKRKHRHYYYYLYDVKINVNDKIINIDTFRIKEEAEFVKSIIENSSEFVYE